MASIAQGPGLSPVRGNPPSRLRRIRNVDWIAVLEILDADPGEWYRVGVFDSSTATHIRKGRYEYIDPALYEVKQGRIHGEPNRNRVNIFMRRVA